MTSPLIDLAERCERATESNRDLEMEIGRLLFALPRLLGQDWTVPRYTASLDSAMTLVPEGWDWLVRNDADEKFAHVTRDFQSVCEISGGEWVDRSTGYSAPAFAATPALALCAAALRARYLSLKEGEGGY